MRHAALISVKACARRRDNLSLWGRSETPVDRAEDRLGVGEVVLQLSRKDRLGSVVSHPRKGEGPMIDPATVFQGVKAVNGLIKNSDKILDLAAAVSKASADKRIRFAKYLIAVADIIEKLAVALQSENKLEVASLCAQLEANATYGGQLFANFVPLGHAGDIAAQLASQLLFDPHISETWKSLGDPYRKFSNYQNIRTLKRFADATQQIYLGLPSFYAERQAQLTRKMQNKHKMNTSKS